MELMLLDGLPAPPQSKPSRGVRPAPFAIGEHEELPPSKRKQRRQLQPDFTQHKVMFDVLAMEFDAGAGRPAVDLAKFKGQETWGPNISGGRRVVGARQAPVTAADRLKTPFARGGGLEEGAEPDALDIFSRHGVGGAQRRPRLCGKIGATEHDAAAYAQGRRQVQSLFRKSGKSEGTARQAMLWEAAPAPA
eukprot:CAMPEP_0170135668 /NCGR_PEP_ID=MMETSP0033_2-20121228/2596_1 /TAXON_ID=195969 /ORGANISM="Dolichomastix tenuilepis, Strain CCMP3274" /LENGTH=191 /DNA_ID=CAMNT_0010371271 /DNA_START=62 /DNA_END=637 /DNA_ORIENTATION=-